MQYIIYNFIAITVSWIFFQNYKNITKNFNLIDDKNKNYAFKPTPTGSGIIFVLIFLIGNIFFFILDENFKSELPNRYYLLIFSILTLSLLSFRDDIKPIDPILRLIFQIILTYLAIASLKLNVIPFPDKLTFLLAVLIWIYITNITNFIDGSDGFLIGTFIFYCANVIVLSWFFDLNIFSKYFAMMCIPFSIIFLYFNKPAAKLFMGDAGSIFIGFVSGYFFLELIVIGKWYLAISLMSYKLVDCSYCLIKKFKRGIMPWVGLYDYFFLIPTLKNNINHTNVLILQTIFQSINFTLIFSIEFFQLKYLFVVSVLLSAILCFIYKNLEGSLKFLKIKK